MIEFKQRSEDSKLGWDLLKASKYITVYGSYNNGIKDILLNICSYLINKGFTNTKIVEEYETPEIDSVPLNWYQKSCYFVDFSDVNLFFFFKNTDNQSVSIESKHAISKPNSLYRSLFFEEKEVNEEHGALKSVLGTDLIGKGINAFPFDRENILKVAHKQLHAYLYNT